MEILFSSINRCKPAIKNRKNNQKLKKGKTKRLSALLESGGATKTSIKRSINVRVRVKWFEVVQSMGDFPCLTQTSATLSMQGDVLCGCNERQPSLCCISCMPGF